MFDSILRNHSAFDLLLLFIAVVAMPLLSTFAGRQLAKQMPQARRLIPRYWQTFARGWIVVLIVVAVWLRLGRPFSELGLAPQLGTWDMAGLGAVALGALILFVQLFLLKSLPPERLERTMKALESMKVTPSTRGELAVFVLVAITAGIWEELLYRGFLIWFLVPLTGIGGAIMLSSLAFGIGHIYQGPSGVVRTGVIGLGFAILYVLSGTLWWLMAAHAMMDIYGGFAARRVKQLAARKRATDAS